MGKILESAANLQAWRDRMSASGHGTFDKVDSGEAIRIARGSKADASLGVSLDVHGISAGEPVVVAATDTGVDPVEGILYAATDDRISISHEDSRAGSVVVHFPRLGFEMRRIR